MCCEPGHVGAPIEWHRELADAPLSVPCPQQVTRATLAAWARMLAPVVFLYSPRPVSSERGRGRALPQRSTKDESVLPDLPLSEDFNRWRGPI